MGLFSKIEDVIGSDLYDVNPEFFLHEQRLKSDKGPEKPDPTAEQLALERRQQAALDKETEEMERRAKMMARSRLGANTLLSGAEPTQERMVTRGSTSGAGTAGGSLLGGGSTGGTGGGGGGASAPSRGIPSGTTRMK